MPRTARIEDGLIAAVDLGSNSFHLAVARIDHGEVRMVEGLSEKVQLGAGLDENNRLTEIAQGRALACLSRFSQHLAGVEPRRLRVVGTNALRAAKNASTFLRKAEKILNHPIEVIAGREEARLIYLGVAHTRAGTGRRLVVDIGGGSTEFIIGEHFDTLATESLHMGCVSYTTRFFADGHISAKALDRAVTAARQEIIAIKAQYQGHGWDLAIGSSGTIKAVRQVLVELGWASPEGRITLEALIRLKATILGYRDVRDIVLPGLKEDRKAIMPAGFAIVLAIFEEFGISEMDYSDGALREGVLYDMLGRFGQADVRDRSVQAMMSRYYVDAAHAQRVEKTAMTLYRQVAADLHISDEESADLLHRAALMHEVGLAISHASFHKHGAYLLKYSDMPGFSRQSQEAMSLLVGAHRRKIKPEHYSEVLNAGGLGLFRLLLLLRLAVLLNHSRSRDELPDLTLRIDGTRFLLGFPRYWLDKHPLTLVDLEEEAGQYAGLGLELVVG
jgi:exopolyphosphatase/guanosine-5'-triphosphate,3'-diphosphate pyrophosphatase